jgi:hypothetical protein
MKKSVLMATLLAWSPIAYGSEGGKTHRTEHGVVSYSGVSEAYAKAIGGTVEAARAAAEASGFNMPRTIEIQVRLQANGSLRLWTDGDSRITLVLGSENQLLKPSTSGVFHIYGLCHEVGHLAMYRRIADHSFLKPEAAEGWAHYLGSRLVDAVYAKEGKDLWPDPYDYREDGTGRLEAQLEKPKADGSTPPAKKWKELVEILGDKGTANLFGEWGKAEIDKADPGQALRTILLAAKRDERLGAWWTSAENVLVLKRPQSDLKSVTARREDLSGDPMELSRDDGKAAGKRSIAGAGHAARFDSPGPGWYLTKVTVHGSRYGTARPPAENFRVWLCDKDFKAIREFPFPFSRFERGEPTWVALDMPPTLVPKEFCVCVAFNPTGAKGVFVSHDQESSGFSMTGIPGQEGVQFKQGDWMIRVSLDQIRPVGLRNAPATQPAGGAGFQNVVLRDVQGLSGGRDLWLFADGRLIV